MIASITGDELKISGTPTEETPGTFNYSIVIDNHLEQTSSAPFVSATVSKVISGSISIINTETTSPTDGGDDSAEQQTFLERYNGVGFADDEEYFFFNDNDVLIKYVFVSNENGNECSELKEGTNTVDGETFTLRIVTNSYNRLKIEMTDNGETHNIEFVSTADGNSLQVYDDDDDDNEDYYVLNKTTESLESLCANTGTTSSTDGGNDSAEQQTFLERYNGVGFGDDEEYFFFNDDDVLIKYVDVYEDGNECSELKEGTNTVDGETFTLRIVTNSYDRLKIEITEDGETYNIQFISSADGNSIQVNDDAEMVIMRVIY